MSAWSSERVFRDLSPFLTLRNGSPFVPESLRLMAPKPPSLLLWHKRSESGQISLCTRERRSQSDDPVLGRHACWAAGSVRLQRTSWVKNSWVRICSDFTSTIGWDPRFTADSLSDNDLELERRSRRSFLQPWLSFEARMECLRIISTAGPRTPGDARFRDARWVAVFWPRKVSICHARGARSTRAPAWSPFLIWGRSLAGANSG